MKEAIATYLETGVVRGWAPTTVKANRLRLDPLLVFLQRRSVQTWADVRDADLDAFMQHLAEEQAWAKTSLRAAASTVRSFFRALANQGTILRNPALAIPVPDDGEPDLPAPPLTIDEVAKLHDSIDASDVIAIRNRLHLDLCYSCAVRIEESVNLNLDHLDLRRRILTVIDGKGGRDRQVPLMAGVLGNLKNYLALRKELLRGPDQGILLLSRLGRRINPVTFRGWLAKHAQAVLGRHVHPHLLRHSLAVHLLQNGTDIRHVQDWLGHASLETTKIYLRLTPGHLRQDYDEAMPAIAVAPVAS